MSLIRSVAELCAFTRVGNLFNFISSQNFEGNQFYLIIVCYAMITT